MDDKSFDVKYDNKVVGVGLRSQAKADEREAQINDLIKAARGRRISETEFLIPSGMGYTEENLGAVLKRILRRREFSISVVDSQ